MKEGRMINLLFLSIGFSPEKPEPLARGMTMENWHNFVNNVRRTYPENGCESMGYTYTGDRYRDFQDRYEEPILKTVVALWAISTQVIATEIFRIDTKYEERYSTMIGTGKA